MYHHAGFRLGGAGWWELTRVSGSRGISPGEQLSGLCSLCCVSSSSVSLLLLFPSVCCSVKLPLSRPTSFCLFLSILLCTPAGGGVATWRFLLLAAAKPQHIPTPIWYFILLLGEDHLPFKCGFSFGAGILSSQPGLIWVFFENAYSTSYTV